MPETTQRARKLLPIGLGLMLAAAITFFTLVAFEDIAIAGDSAVDSALVQPHR